MAFPVLTMVVGFMAGIGIGNVVLSGENDTLYAQFLTARDAQNQSEAQAQALRQDLRDQAEEFEAIRTKLVADKIAQDRQLGQADAILNSMRDQLNSCQSNMAVALSTVESTTAELDSLRQTCSIPSQ